MLGPLDSDACSYRIMYWLLYAQYGILLEYDFLLGSLNIIFFFFLLFVCERESLCCFFT